MPYNIVYIHKIDISKLGSTLKKARINKDYKGSAIADFLGIAACTLRNFEAGNRMPQLNVLYALCELYDLKIDEVLKEVLL